MAVVSVVSWAVLEEASLEALVAWEHDLENQLHRHPIEGAKLNPVAQIEPDVWELLYPRLTPEQQAAAAKGVELKELMRWLVPVLRPTKGDICLSKLRRFQWVQPDSAVEISLVRYSSGYKRLATRMNPPLCEEAIVETYVASLRGPVGSLLVDAKKASGERTLDGVIRLAGELARDEKTYEQRHEKIGSKSVQPAGKLAASSGQVSAHGDRVSAKASSGSLESVHRRGSGAISAGHDTARSTSRTQREAMLVQKAREFCLVNRLCFACMSPDHVSANCPLMKGAKPEPTIQAPVPEQKPTRAVTTTDIATADPRRRAQSVSGGRSTSARFAQVAADAAAGQSLPPRHSKIKAEYAEASTSGTAHGVNGESDEEPDGDEQSLLDDVQAAVKSAKQKRRIVQAIEKQRETVIEGEPFIMINQQGTAPNGGDLRCKVDTGSNVAMTSSDYAKRIGATIISGPTCRCHAVGGILVVKQHAIMELALTSDAPKRMFDVLVLTSEQAETASIEDYILLPVSSLVGYSIDVEPSRIVIRWSGRPEVPEDDGLELRGDEMETVDPSFFRRVGLIQSINIVEPPSISARQDVVEVGAIKPVLEVEGTPCAEPRRIQSEQAKLDPFSRDQTTPVWEIVEKEIRWGEELSPEQLQRVKALVQEYIIAIGRAGPIPSRLRKLTTKLKPNYVEVRQMPRRFPKEKREYLWKWMQALVAAGMYKQLFNNAWSTPMNIVPKGNGEYRPVGDYRAVNEQCEVDAGPMANHRQEMTTFAGCCYFAVFDMENGYLQGEIDGSHFMRKHDWTVLVAPAAWAIIPQRVRQQGGRRLYHSC